MSDYELCTEPDQYFNDFVEGNTAWIVTLDDGVTVYQDDDRPGLTVNSAWTRLKTYCEATGRYITEMHIRFRSHTKPVKSNAEGYFFCKSALGHFASSETHLFYLVGTVEDGILSVEKWKVPELLLQGSETRNMKDSKNCLIIRKTL